MLQKRLFALFLVSAAVLASLYFSIRLARELKNYLSFTSQTEAQIHRWEIKEIKEKFAIRAVYSFGFQGKNWTGSTTLAKPWHLNEPSAIVTAKEKAKQAWIVWFNPKNPSESSLEKFFPTYLLFRTIICYLVLVYFLIISKRFGRLVSY